MGILIERTVYETLEQGVYPAIVESIEEATGQYGTQLKWRFELLDQEHEGRKLTAWCSALLSPKSKLNKWATAILGPAMPQDGMLDCDDLINQKVRLIVKTETGKDGLAFNKVDDVLPWKSAPRPAQRPVQPVKTVPPPPYIEVEYEHTDADE